MQERTYVIGKREVHFLEFGQWSQEAIVILPGWSRDAPVYKKLGEKLSAQHYVLIFDLPGFGKSQQTEKVKFKDFARQVVGILDELDIKQTVLVGHSMGGPVAIELAVGYQDKVKQIFLFGSAGIPPTRSRLGWAWVGFKSVLYNLRTAGNKLQQITDIVRSVQQGLTHLNWYYQTFILTTRCDIRDQLLIYQVPAKVVVSSHDSYFPDTETLCKCLGVGPIDREKGLGHDSIFLFPDETTQIININGHFRRQ